MTGHLFGVLRRISQDLTLNFDGDGRESGLLFSTPLVRGVVMSRAAERRSRRI